MNNNLNLDGLRRWPRWTIIPIAIGLALFAVVLGLILEPAAGALSPVLLTPVPTMPAIAYSEGISEGCHDCHFSLSALESSAVDPDSSGAYLIESDSVVTPHGKLGCLACHGGDGQAADKGAAHQGLIADMTVQDPEKCLICHQSLPDEIPHDRLRVPHGTIIDRIQQGEPCDVHCSDCHGGVGHGFDPVSGETFCSMTVCLDCHQEQSLDIQMANCDACHLGPHDVAASLTCNDCHTSTETWQPVALGVHPVLLPGRHGETDCFACHQYPDFKGLNNVCTDCHVSGHTDWGDHDCASCHDAGATWDMVAQVWDEHGERWDQYKGEHLKVACAGCHFDGYLDKDSSCTSCHKVPESHDGGRDAIECTNCHQADQPWAGTSQ
jgi:hypothetical protein